MEQPRIEFFFWVRIGSATNPDPIRKIRIHKKTIKNCKYLQVDIFCISYFALSTESTLSSLVRFLQNLIKNII